MEIDMNWLVGAIVLALIGGFGAYIRTSVVSRATTVKKHGVDIETLKLEQKHLKNSLDEIKEHAINGDDVRRIMREENTSLHTGMSAVHERLESLGESLNKALIQIAEQSGYNRRKREEE